MRERENLCGVGERYRPFAWGVERSEKVDKRGEEAKMSFAA
jgi:hypothetical protein